MVDLVTSGYPIVLTAVCGYIVWLLQEQRRDTKRDRAEAEAERKANCKGTRCLLRQQLIDYHDKYIDRGCISPHGYENLDEMITAYEGLGGNGKVRKMAEETKALPIREAVNPQEEKHE